MEKHGTVKYYNCTVSGCNTTKVTFTCSSCGHSEESNETEHYLPCTTCDGTGEIDHPCQHGYTTSHSITVDCDVCSGTGVCDHQFSDWEFFENHTHKRTC